MNEMDKIERAPLANDWNNRRQDGYDVVVVGSGYGGAITAARLATAEWDGENPSICVLERGKEWLPGDFPFDLERGAGALKSSANPLGLHDIHFGLDISVWQGSGLGGTSLINANVAIEPDAEVFDNPQWPEAIRAFRNSGAIGPYFDRVRQTLGAGQHPIGAQLSKVQALQQGQRGVAGANFDVANIAVNFSRDPENRWGVKQQECINCGDCVTGCNVGAKNTLDTNYLAIAKSGGAHVFPQVEVARIEKNAVNGWYKVLCVRRESDPASSEGAVIPARRVILAAGSPGSSAVLLRSRDQGLELPDTLGTRFSGNGDFFGVAYNCDVRTDSLGWGAFPDSDRAGAINPDDGPTRHPGPTIVARVKYNKNQPLSRRVTIEDLSFPFTYVDVARRVFAFLIGKDTDSGIIDGLTELGRRGLDVIGLDRTLAQGALNHTLMYLVVGQDDASGRIELDNGQAKIRWRGVGDQETFHIANGLMEDHATQLGATYIQNPSWAFTPSQTVITVHPLGGCPMGETEATGLVNDAGQVYDGRGGKHEGLYVADASIVPTSLGVNPFLTISALSERIAEKLIEEMGGRPKLVARAASAP